MIEFPRSGRAIRKFLKIDSDRAAVIGRQDDVPDDGQILWSD